MFHKTVVETCQYKLQNVYTHTVSYYILYQFYSTIQKLHVFPDLYFFLPNTKGCSSASMMQTKEITVGGKMSIADSV